MKLTDLLKMSMGSLFKRKLRTVLTVLGVTIGVASIVVMMSLGLGLKKSMTEDLANYASLTSVTVYDESRGSRMVSSDGGDDSEEKEEKHLDDKALEEMLSLSNVKAVYPVIETNAIIKYGAWEAWAQVKGVDEGYLERQNVKIGSGSYPQKTGSKPEVFYGNMMLAEFSNDKTESGYWYDGTLPDIDLSRDSMIFIFDIDNYMASKGSGRGDVDGGESAPVVNPKKYLLDSAGVQEGDLDDYNAYCYYVYTNIDDLKSLLKKEFKGRTIPNQPTKKNGKPYKEIFYTSLIVETDSIDHVSELQNTISSMGYSAESDAEWIKQEQQSMNIIQLVLGGIGAVSLFVAAIGITNTMMMSIYERTKEIGIMKVLGCDLKNIQGMFLTEAGIIGFIGGVVGLVISYGISIVINAIAASSEMMDLESSISYIPFWLAALSLIFAVFVGMIAGFFPSLRAMRLSPLAAIRNE